MQKKPYKKEPSKTKAKMRTGAETEAAQPQAQAAEPIPTGPPQSRPSGFVGKRRNFPSGAAFRRPSGGKRSGKGNF